MCQKSKNIILKLITQNNSLGIHREIALRWMPQKLSNEKLTLVQLMAWCHQATSHYLSHCWPRSMSPYCITRPQWVNCNPQCLMGLDVKSLRLRHNYRHFADNIFKCIFVNENVSISLEISPKFIPMVWLNNIPALIQIMAWCRAGDKPLSEPMMHG